MSETDRSDTNTQEAPYPVELAELVAACQVDPGWKISLAKVDRGQGSKGLTLSILVQVFDSYHPEQGRNYRVLHYFPVPPAAYDRANWTRWLFDRYQDVLSHEGCEMFQINGKRPFAPHHGPGSDPYTIWQIGSVEDARKRFDDFS